MSYQVHDFTSHTALLAAQLNEMDAQIAKNETVTVRETQATPDSYLNRAVSPTGTLVTTTSFKAMYFPVPAGMTHVTVTGAGRTSATARAIALLSFVDAGDNITAASTSTIAADDTTTHTVTEAIPSTAVTVLVCVSADYLTEMELTTSTYQITFEAEAEVDTAIRDISERLDAAEDAVTDVQAIKAALSTTYTLEYPALGQYIALNGAIGSVVDIDHPVSTQGYGYLIVPCRKGDVFVVTATASSVSRAWAFTDTDYKLISRSEADAHAEALRLTAPADGYFISDANKNRDNGLIATLASDPVSEAGVEAKIGVYFPPSPMRKHFDFAAADLSQYIHVSHGDFDLFTQQTTAAEVIAAFEALAAGSDGYMTSEELGLASDETTMLHAYTLEPLSHYTGLTFFVISGQHGFEKSSNFGLYYFLRELIHHYADNPSLMYLRNWVKIVCIPMMNPWGFDHMSYLNANSVNLNLNWPTPYWTQGTEGTTSYAGAEPGDQPEVQYAKALLDELKDDVFWFTDFHTQGSEPVTSYRQVFWHAAGTDINADEYTKIGVTAMKAHVNDTTARIPKDYPTDCPTPAVCGHFDFTYEYSHSGRAAVYARYIGVQGETFEGFPGWPGGVKYAPTCHQANADVFANWMRCVIAAYEREGGR